MTTAILRRAESRDDRNMSLRRPRRRISATDGEIKDKLWLNPDRHEDIISDSNGLFERFCLRRLVSSFYNALAMCDTAFRGDDSLEKLPEEDNTGFFWLSDFKDKEYERDRVFGEIEH
ncbi:hypothetical protein TIFTF001_032844 [Ficus carica]|uniref:Uncharacterized protein n=1 Tax=Ficus carica TaxID=3494 RepID=A0AA88J6Z2_FICCA|nr:hypothetical protein TIFTF001_032844 [Ficus carica]